jgi:hypothetical protein
MTAKHEHMPEDPPSRDRQVYTQKLPVAPVKQPKHIIARGDRTLLLESCDSTGRNGTIKYLVKDLLTHLDHQDKIHIPSKALCSVQQYRGLSRQWHDRTAIQCL